MHTFAQKPKSTQQTASTKFTKPSRTFFGQSCEVHSFFRLQRTIGNQAVQRLVRSDAEECNAVLPVPNSPRFGHDFSPIPVFSTSPVQIHPKLTVSTPGDIYEREADRVADHVMRMQVPQVQRACACGGSCPRCQDLEQEQEHSLLQPKTITTTNGEISAPPSVSETLNQHGQPLDASTRAFMEPRLGVDLSRIRVHSDPKAAKSARAVNARAYTVGQSIVFGEGRYAPGTSKGRRLLAHELVHTVQQTGGVPMLQRISYDKCTSTQEGTVLDSHNRAIEMLDNAITKLRTYNGTTPADVRASMNRHFHGTSSALAGWIRFNLRYLRLFVNLPQYECQSTQSIPNPAWTMWCVPFTDIELYPNWFSSSRDYRAALMIHEWVHHYGCNFDLGYASSPGYSGHSTARALLNADPWQRLIYEIR